MKRIVIFGLGGSYERWGTIIQKEIEKNGDVIIGYSDNDINKRNSIINWISLENLTMNICDQIIICSTFSEEIKAGLIKKGISVEMLSSKEYLALKYKIHPKAANFMNYRLYKDVKEYEMIIGRKPNSFFEIGANFAQDAALIANIWDIPKENVFVFEPHPQIIKEVKRCYEYQCFDYAVSNKKGKATFNICDINSDINTGMSSLRFSENNNYEQIEVDMICMKDFIAQNNISHIDFCKIDVEGMTWEVLDGFGKEISVVDCFQIEGEYSALWKGQKLFGEIAEFLWKKGYRMLNFELYEGYNQCDSLWIRSELIGVD